MACAQLATISRIGIGRHDDGGLGAARAQFGDQAGDGGRRRAQDRQVRRRGQRRHLGVARHAVQRSDAWD
jgi:hypothetical protein